MKKFTILPAALLAASFCFATPMYAQSEDFRPYKGICWGMFWDQNVEFQLNSMLPVEYIRTGVDQYVFPDFVGCGKELVVNLVNESIREGYYDIELEMDGGLYDDYGYFYAPFTSGEHKWTITTSNNELIGPILQPYSYFHEELEYIGLYYVRYTAGTEFAYFDIKLQEDYYEGTPRTYLDEEEVDGIANIAAPAALAKSYYDFQGRRVNAAHNGLTIEGGRKVIKGK